MLGKLFKYEFRATGRVFLPAYAVLLVMSLVARLLYAWQLRPDTGGSYGFDPDILTFIVTLVMVMLFTAVWVVTLVVILRRFWTNILGREGYLMNVLPVDPWEHICSKAVVSLVWVLLSAVASAVALFCMLPLRWLFGMSWTNIANAMNSGWAYLAAENATGQGVLVIVLAVLNALAWILRFVLMAYAAMCVGQLVNRHRVWASLGAWFGISIVHSTLGSWLFTDRMIGGTLWSLLGGDGPTVFRYRGEALTVRDFLSAVNTDMLVYLIFTVIVGAALFFVSQWILKKRLNLQ